MPIPQLQKLAKDTQKPIETIEQYWNSAKKDIGKDEKDFEDKDWATVYSITKKRATENVTKLQSFLESKESAYNFLEASADVKVENPGILDVPEGKSVDSLSQSHFEDLISKKGWNEISKALINLVRFNKNNNKSLSDWADSMQNKLSSWVDTKRKENPDFAK